MALPWRGENPRCSKESINSRVVEISTDKSNQQGCRACGKKLASKRYVVRERQLGIGGDFEYGECQGCGSLSIVEVPTDLERYYGRSYYSFVSGTPIEPTGWRRVESKVRKELSTELRLDRIARKVWRRLGLSHDARILDVAATTACGRVWELVRDRCLSRPGARTHGALPYWSEIDRRNGWRVGFDRLSSCAGTRN